MKRSSRILLVLIGLPLVFLLVHLCFAYIDVLRFRKAGMPIPSTSATEVIVVAATGQLFVAVLIAFLTWRLTDSTTTYAISSIRMAEEMEREWTRRHARASEEAAKELIATLVGAEILWVQRGDDPARAIIRVWELWQGPWLVHRLLISDATLREIGDRFTMIVFRGREVVAADPNSCSKLGDSFEKMRSTLSLHANGQQIPNVFELPPTDEALNWLRAR